MDPRLRPFHAKALNAVFEIDLPIGAAQLLTYLDEQGDNVGGDYFTDTELLDGLEKRSE